MSLVRLRAALGEGRTPTNSPRGQESGRPAPSVGLTPSRHAEVRPAATCRVRSRFSPLAAEKGCARMRPSPSELILWDPHTPTWQKGTGQEDDSDSPQLSTSP